MRSDLETCSNCGGHRVLQWRLDKKITESAINYPDRIEEGIFGAISWIEISLESMHPALLCLDCGLCATALNTDKARDIIEKYATYKIKAGLESGNSKKK